MSHEINYRHVEIPELDAFLAEYDALCRKHGMQFADEEYGYDGGSYMTIEPYSGSPYLNLEYADQRIPCIARAFAQVEAIREAEREAEELAEREKEAKAQAEAATYVWLIHKHIETGELLGPSVKFGVPTRVVHAVRDGRGWREVPASATEPEGPRREAARSETKGAAR
jgi:hypothetical protein